MIISKVGDTLYRIKTTLIDKHRLYFGGQGGLVVKRPPGNQKAGGSNPTTATW